MKTIECEYKEIIEFYSEVLNKEKLKTTNDEPTPIGCVEEMVSKIPDELWKRDNLKILDPCCGNGNFFIVIFFLLMKSCSQDDKIRLTRRYILENILHFNDINIERLNNVSKIFCGDEYNLRLSSIDYQQFDKTNKYDLIVANPPYAKLMEDGRRASKNHNLIHSFLSISLDLLKPNGYILFISPNNWMSLSDRNVIVKRMTSLQMIHLNIENAKKWFPKIGSSFTWYIVQNTNTRNDFVVEGVWKKIEYKNILPSYTIDFIPLFYTPIVLQILKKTILNDSIPKFIVQTSSDLHKTTKKNLLSNVQTESYPYRIIHTPKQTIYSSRPHKFQNGIKLFISTTDKYKLFIEENVGMTQSIAFILYKTWDEAYKYKKILEHPLYVFLNNICRWGNFNNIRILQRFPIPHIVSQPIESASRNYDDDIYSSFKITSQEQEHILHYQ